MDAYGRKETVAIGTASPFAEAASDNTENAVMTAENLPVKEPQPDVYVGSNYDATDFDSCNNEQCEKVQETAAVADGETKSVLDLGGDQMDLSDSRELEEGLADVEQQEFDEPRRLYRRSKTFPPDRLEQHLAKMAFFKGIGPDPPPIFVGQKLGLTFSSFNPLFDDLWLPWARKVQYIDHLDFSMIVANPKYTEEGLRGRELGLNFSYAIPIRHVLEYMVHRAPEGKIAEIGAGSGYWAAFLQHLGADIVAVDNCCEGIRPIYFPACKRQDGTEFLKDGGADGRALFLCWPQNPKENPATLAFLKTYSGHTIFFVGEVESDWTLDILAWVLQHKDEGWEVEKTIEIPCWLCAYDKFFCLSKKLVCQSLQDSGQATSY